MLIAVSIFFTTIVVIYAMYEYYYHRKSTKEIKHQTKILTAGLDAIRDERYASDKELMYLLGYIDGQLGDPCNPSMTYKQFNERISIILVAYEDLKIEAEKDATNEANNIIDKLEKGLL